MAPMELFWEEPSYLRFLERLASFSRLILFDKRGAGGSDRVASIPPIEEQIDDLTAVMPGHASIRETAATYCHWLPANRRGALDVPMTPRRIPERHDLQPTCNQTGRFLPAGCASG